MLSEIMPAYDWAVQNGIDVINMSFGSESHDPDYHNLIKKCRDAGIFLVAAAGNESQPRCLYPSAYDECICVASVDMSGNLSNFSNWDPDVVDVVAYGENILSDNSHFTGNNNLLLDLTGTR
jgi:subtilisin